MDFHEIDTKGKLWIERVSTLPTWAATDVGRIVYAVDEDIFYKASATAWEQFGQALSQFAGYMQRPLFEYSSTTAIGIYPGRFHHSGTVEQILNMVASITFTFGPGGSNGSSDALTASDWHYLYIDDSALSGEVLTAAQFINKTTEPSWNDTKLGWYDGNDRCIGAFYANSSSQISKFYNDGSYIQWDGPITVASNLAPGSTWSTQVTMILPSFGKWANATFLARGGNQKDILLYIREADSTGSGYLVGRHYEDSSGDNQGDSDSVNTVSRIVTDLTNKQIDIKFSASGPTVYVYQNGYYLPYGM